MSEKRKAAYRQINLVFVGLAILTGLEFWVSVSFNGNLVFLLLIALFKAGIIVNFFMHVYRLWREESH